jgi:two-component system response regulator ResD
MAQLPVLVVDDNEFIRASMIKFLEMNSYEVVGVGHAQDAMDELRATEYGLIITDVLMPDTDGFELVDFIRGYTEPVKSTPIIAISGGGRTIDADSALNALEEKVDLIMKKPFSKKELLDKTAELIKKESTSPDTDGAVYIE